MSTIPRCLTGCCDTNFRRVQCGSLTRHREGLPAQRGMRNVEPEKRSKKAANDLQQDARLSARILDELAASQNDGQAIKIEKREACAGSSSQQ